MSDNPKVVINWLETKMIPIDSIDMSNLQARQDKINAGLEAFAEQIRKVGQIQEVVVYQKGDRYELLVGQRRFFAFQKVLEWTEIRAAIIEEPKSDQMKTTISWLENHARTKMTNKDTLRHITRMRGEQIHPKEIAQTLGITQSMIKKAMALPECPNVEQEACESGKISIENAIKATKAKNFIKWDTPESEGPKVLDFALRLQQFEKPIADTTIDNISGYQQENPEADDDELLTEGTKKTTIRINLEFSNNDSNRIKSYQKKNDFDSAGEAVTDLVLEGLDQHGE